jgi:hypothetical protein
MSHKWQLNGIKFNFCVKCGCKKTWAGKWHRCMSKTAYNKHLPHKLKAHVNKCKICGLEQSVYGCFANVILSSDNTGIAYVPYKLIEGKDGKMRARQCCWWKYHWDSEKKMSKKIVVPGIIFWPVYCLLTEDEAMIKDIIL